MLLALYAKEKSDEASPDVSLCSMVKFELEETTVTTPGAGGGAGGAEGGEVGGGEGGGGDGGGDGGGGKGGGEAVSGALGGNEGGGNEGYDGGEGGCGAHGANTHTVMVSMAVLPVHSGSCPTTSLTVLSPARSGKVTLEDSLQPVDLCQKNFWLSESAAG